jgi:hypothetical protein
VGGHKMQFTKLLGMQCFNDYDARLRQLFQPQHQKYSTIFVVAISATMYKVTATYLTNNDSVCV